MIWAAVAFGLLLGGLINFYVPREYISHYLGQPGKRTILYAITLGFALSCCSHGILAIAIALWRKGASASAIIAFLLAAPWANLAILPLFFTFFGVHALLIITSALAIAAVMGFAFLGLERSGVIERRRYIELRKFDIRTDIARRLSAWRTKLTVDLLAADARGVLAGTASLSRTILWWILLGIFAAAAVRAYVPTDLMLQYLGKSGFGLLITLGLATVLEVCSEGSSPLAFEIFVRTGAFGNAFAFLLAGVATDYTEIGALATNVSKKAALLLPALAIPQILVLGWLFNIIV
jgi:hypothetical protein